MQTRIKYVRFINNYVYFKEILQINKLYTCLWISNISSIY